MRSFIIVACLVISSLASAQVLRFKPEQLQFKLQDNEGNTQACEHKLLEHVPWWSVTCGKRSYTVNTWAQLAFNKPQDLTKVTFMYDVSEGVVSSGEKLVQFNSHYTNIIVESLTFLKKLTSDMDVRNGQSNLIIEVDL